VSVRGFGYKIVSSVRGQPPGPPASAEPTAAKERHG